MNIMKENIKLIRMITDLREEVKTLISIEKNTWTKSKLKQQGKQIQNQGEESKLDENGKPTEETLQQQQDLQYKRQYIEELRKRLMQAQEENNFMQQELQQNMQQMNEMQQQ